MLSVQLKVWKPLLTNNLSSHRQLILPLPLPLPFTSTPHITFLNFCSRSAPSSTTPPHRGLVTDFLLNKCGLSEEEITKTFRHRTEFLSIKSSRSSEEILELLNGEERIKSSILLIQKLGVEGETLSKLLARQPRLLSYSPERVIESFKLAEHLGLNKGSKMFVAAMRSILGVSKENAESKLQCLSSVGFSQKQASEIFKRCPFLFALSEEKVKNRLDFLVKSMGIPLDNIGKNPALICYSLEKRLIPRLRVMEALKSMQLLNTELNCRIFFLTEKCFLEKYINKNAHSSILLDIYHSGKVDLQQGATQ
eukprot:PITA_12878